VLFNISFQSNFILFSQSNDDRKNINTHQKAIKKL